MQQKISLPAIIGGVVILVVLVFVLYTKFMAPPAIPAAGSPGGPDAAPAGLNGGTHAPTTGGAQSSSAKR